MLGWFDLTCRGLGGANALICCELENFGFCLFLSPFAEAPRWTQIFKIELGILEMVTGDAVVV